MKDHVAVIEVPPRILGEHLPVNITQYGQILCATGHLSFSPGVLAPIDLNPSWVESVKSASSVMGVPATGANAVKPPVWSLVRPTFFEKPQPAECMIVEGEKVRWLVVDRDRGNRQEASVPRKPPKGKASTDHSLYQF